MDGGGDLTVTPERKISESPCRLSRRLEVGSSLQERGAITGFARSGFLMRVFLRRRTEFSESNFGPWWVVKRTRRNCLRYLAGELWPLPGLSLPRPPVLAVQASSFCVEKLRVQGSQGENGSPSWKSTGVLCFLSLVCPFPVVCCLAWVLCPLLRLGKRTGC